MTASAPTAAPCSSIRTWRTSRRTPSCRGSTRAKSTSTTAAAAPPSPRASRIPSCAPTAARRWPARRAPPRKWYTDIRDGLNGQATDSKIACRPYVLVQLTDGQDSCDTDSTNGPVAAAAGFVAATKSGAKNPNKVYVIGLAFGANAGPLDKIAQAGGTGQARLANSQQDIEAALADIVSSSVLKEICNDADDNCNGQCDENFPDVAVDKTKDATCTVRAAKTCNNGYPAASQCYDSGVFVCSTDSLSEVCSAQVCNGASGGTITSPVAGTMRVSNVNGITSNMVGELLVVRGSVKAGNNGAFVITAVGAGTVDVTNAGVTVPDASSVSYGVPSTQGAGATITRPVAGTERLTLPSGTTAGVLVGDQVIVVGATPVADNGTYTVTAVTGTTIDLANANAAVGTASARWADPRLCPGVESCDGKDDDCNGVIDDCTVGVPGSCCTDLPAEAGDLQRHRRRLQRRPSTTTRSTPAASATTTSATARRRRSSAARPIPTSPATPARRA